MLVFSAKDSRKIIFMYLANDVIQNSKRKGPEYSREFAIHLPKAFEHMRKFDEKTRGQLNRLLRIWEERGVYDKTQIAKFKAAFTNSSTEAPNDVIKRCENAPRSGTPPITRKRPKNEVGDVEKKQKVSLILIHILLILKKLNLV